MENSEFMIESSENIDEKMRVREEMEKRELSYRRNTKRKDELEREVGFSRLNLKYIQYLSQETFENILATANLIDPPEVVSEEDPASPQPQSPVSDSVFLPEADDEPMNSDKSEMIVILEEVERTRQNFFQAQELFDGTRNRNAVDQLEYQQLKAIGMANFSEHVMHQLQFQRGSMNTRVLIEAEQEHEEAKAMARAHGFLENQLDQESDFVDDPDDGYLESQDADMIAVPDEGHIHN